MGDDVHLTKPELLGIALLVIVTLTADAFAQEPVTVFAELPRVLETGTRVFVQDEKGVRTKGRMGDLSDSSLQLITGGVIERTVTFNSERVMRVSRIDSRLNGFLIGAIAGAAPGLLAGHWWSTYQYNEGGGHVPLAYLVFGLPIALAGGGIGFAIDGAIDGETLVFARRQGVSFSLKF